jgi:hypothetical protein
MVLVTLSGCGLEGLFANGFHSAYDRPASKIRGQVSFPGARLLKLSVTDGSGVEQKPFLSSMDSTGHFELRLESSQYSMLVVHYLGANVDLRVIIPSLGPESAVNGIDFTAEQVAETLIAEARLAADGRTLAPVSPAAYLGLRSMVHQDAQVAGDPTKLFVDMVGRFLDIYDRFAQATQYFFTPVAAWTDDTKTAIQVSASPIDGNWLKDHGFDYTGLGNPADQATTTAFDSALAAVAARPLYNPAGCPSQDKIRVVFTVDLRAGKLDGNCSTVNRFKWAIDKPGKKMFFVGWIHKDSTIQDPATNNLLGASAPNTIPMYDDGTNGDEVAGDGIWTVTFEVPKRDPLDPTNTSKTLRIGYKYTWGYRGSPWSGSEEWPGNSRILEVVDMSGDQVVYRRDVFGDEATNKDLSNLFVGGTGAISWTTDLHCGGDHPEARESFYDNATCSCGPSYPPPPPSVGPVNVACTAP